MDCQAQRASEGDRRDERDLRDRTLKRSRTPCGGIDAAKRQRLDSSPELDDEGSAPFYIDLTPHNIPHGSSVVENLYEYLSTSLVDPLALIPVLGEPQVAPNQHPKRDPRTCFNCLGDHVLSACPFRRDASVIAANRAAFRQANGPTSDRGRLGIDGDGEDESRRRMLSFVDRFSPGVVSADLREALGYGRAAEGSESASSPEYAFYWMMKEWGYPPGWVAYGEQVTDPLETVRDRIGREQAWEDIDVLAVYGADPDMMKDASVGPGTPSSSSGTDPTAGTGPTAFAGEPAPNEPSAPLPPRGAPPAPPTAPPPPQRLVQYPTSLFDSFTLPIYRPDAPLPISAPRAFHQHLRLYQQPAQVTIETQNGATQREQAEAGSDMELQSSDSDL